MSAASRPHWGRASGRFSTLTARAARWGTCPSRGARPVSGQTGTWCALAVVVVVRAVVVVVEDEDVVGRAMAGFFEWPQPPTRARAAEAARTAATRRPPGDALIAFQRYWPGPCHQRHTRPGRPGTTGQAGQGAGGLGALALAAHGLGGGGDGLRVAQPAAAGVDGPKALVELVDDRHPRGESRAWRCPRRSSGRGA